MQNVEIGLVWRLGVTQGHRKCRHSIERIQLPIRLYGTYASILYRFRDIASYLSKVADFNPLHLHLAAPIVVDPGRILLTKIFGNRKLESLGYRVVLSA